MKMKIGVKKLPKGVGMRLELVRKLPPIADFVASVISDKELKIDRVALENNFIEPELIRKGRGSLNFMVKALRKMGEKWHQYLIYFNSSQFNRDELEYYKDSIELNIESALRETNPDVRFIVDVKKARWRIKRKIIDVPEGEAEKLLGLKEVGGDSE